MSIKGLYIWIFMGVHLFLCDHSFSSLYICILEKGHNISRDCNGGRKIIAGIPPDDFMILVAALLQCGTTNIIAISYKDWRRGEVPGVVFSGRFRGEMQWTVESQYCWDITCLLCIWCTVMILDLDATWFISESNELTLCKLLQTCYNADCNE